MPDELTHFGEGLLLIMMTVVVHATGVLILLWIMFQRQPEAERRFNFMRNTARVAMVVVALLVVHMAEIALWALYYQARGCLPDFPTALFFSLVSYSTVGYGDVSLSREWRLLGGVEALTGTLMVSWSTVLLLGLLHWIYGRRIQMWQGEHLRGEPSTPGPASTATGPHHTPRRTDWE
jgi:hypothetical protein